MMPKGQPAPAWRWLALCAAFLGLTAVLLGAAGSHAIDLSGEDSARRWSTALQLHYFQAAALLALAALGAVLSSQRRWLLPGWIQFTGTLMFCGSLYLRAIHVDWLPTWITPLGGLVLLAGWGLLIVMLAFWRGPTQDGEVH